MHLLSYPLTIPWNISGFEGTETEEGDEAMRHLCEDGHGKVGVARQWEGLEREKYIEPGFYGCEADPEVFNPLQFVCRVGGS
jgi:hypothetical protein